MGRPPGRRTAEAAYRRTSRTVRTNLQRLLFLRFERMLLMLHEPEGSPSGPSYVLESCASSYLLNRTTIAPIKSPFLKSFFGLIGWAL
jgi:hypothetical protein